MKRLNGLICVSIVLSALNVASTTVASSGSLSAGSPRTGIALHTALPSAGSLPVRSERPAVCYAPGTSPEVLKRNAEFANSGTSLLSEPFQFSNRWTTTATDGSGLTLGQVTTLTWNIVPDGTPIGALGGIAGESTAASNLKAFLNGIYGSEATWTAHFQTVFDQWAALTGISYVKVSEDDAVALSTQLEETTLDSWDGGLILQAGFAGRVSVVDSVIRRVFVGMLDEGAAAAARVSIIDSRFEGNGVGVLTQDGQYALKNSAFVGNILAGLVVGGGAADVQHCEFSHNGEAVEAESGGVVRIARSHIFGNTIGLDVAAGGTIVSYGTNVIRGNGTNTVGSIGTIPEQ